MDGFIQESPGEKKTKYWSTDDQRAFCPVKETDRNECLPTIPFVHTGTVGSETRPVVAGRRGRGRRLAAKGHEGLWGEGSGLYLELCCSH